MLLPVPVVFHVGLPDSGIPLERAWLRTLPGCVGVSPAVEGVFRSLCANLALADDADFRRGTWARFLDDARRDQPTLILADEDLALHPRGGRTARRLDALRADVRVVLLVREQRAVLRSLHARYVTGGGSARLREWVDAGVDLGRLRYDVLVAPYLEVLGPERVLVLAAEQFQRDGPATYGRLRSFVLAAGGAGSVEGHPTGPAASPDPPIRLLRLVNRVLGTIAPPPADPPGGPPAGPRSRARGAVAYRVTRLEAGAGRTGRSNLAEADQAALDRVARNLEASNARLAAATILPLRDLGYVLPG